MFYGVGFQEHFWLVLCWEVCPLFRSVLYQRFHCIASFLQLRLSPFLLPTFLFQNVKLGPLMKHNVVWKSQKEKHLPSVTKFDPPEDFLEQLNAQEYGPTMLLIPSSVS